MTVSDTDRMLTWNYHNEELILACGKKNVRCTGTRKETKRKIVNQAESVM